MAKPCNYVSYDPPKPVWYYENKSGIVRKTKAELLGESLKRAHIRITHHDGRVTTTRPHRENVEPREQRGSHRAGGDQERESCEGERMTNKQREERMKTAKSKLIPCVITTDKRGVFMGYIDPSHRMEKSVTTKDVRMIVHWSADVRGLFGLAANGPTKSCRVTAAAPGCVLHGVTAVIDITEKAEKEFKTEPWA